MIPPSLKFNSQPLHKFQCLRADRASAEFGKTFGSARRGQNVHESVKRFRCQEVIQGSDGSVIKNSFSMGCG